MFMKHLIRVAVLLLVVFSCTQEESTNLSKVKTNDNYLLPSSLLNENVGTWEADLDYSLFGEGKKILANQGLEMLDYELQKDSEVLGKEALSQKLLGNSFIPIYDDSLNINNFNLLCVKDIDIKYNTKAEDFYFEKKNIFLSSHLNSLLKRVSVKWLYKGVEIQTECLVTDQSVIYDDILSNLRYIIKEESSYQAIIPTLKLKARTREPGTGSPSSISYSVQSPSLVCYTGAGKVGAIAYYYVQLVGTKDENGKSIDYASYEAPHESGPGFYAVGKIEATRESLGKDGSFSYQYGIGVGTRDITLTWSGSSFTMYGEEQGRTGGESLTANSLN